jgi:hypothetical protein
VRLEREEPHVQRHAEQRHRKEDAWNGRRSGLSQASFHPGPNPTIASYSASVVKIYNSTSSLVRFENKNIFFYFEKKTL